MGMFLDEKALMAAWSFPISAEELVSKAKDILAKGVHRCQDQMSEDFTFSAPFIGPLNKEAFAATMEALDIDAAFPDMQARIYNMRADPLEPGRVWLTSRPLGRNLGYLRLSVPFASAPTGRLVELPPQTSSLVFGADGRVEAWTYGYVMDRRAGNSGGLGGAFGLLWAIGSPFPYPEGHPWSSSWQQRLFNSGSALGKLGALLLDRALSALLPEWLITAHARNTC